MLGGNTIGSMLLCDYCPVLMQELIQNRVVWYFRSSILYRSLCHTGLWVFLSKTCWRPENIYYLRLIISFLLTSCKILIVVELGTTGIWWRWSKIQDFLVENINNSFDLIWTGRIQDLLAVYGFQIKGVSQLQTCLFLLFVLIYSFGAHLVVVFLVSQF